MKAAEEIVAYAKALSRRMYAEVMKAMEQGAPWQEMNSYRAALNDIVAYAEETEEAEL